MLKVIYFLCCIASICVVVYMGYESYKLFLGEKLFTPHNIAWLLGTLGWVLITFKIVTRQYKWTARLCK